MKPRFYVATLAAAGILALCGFSRGAHAVTDVSITNQFYTGQGTEPIEGDAAPSSFTGVWQRGIVANGNFNGGFAPLYGSNSNTPFNIISAGSNQSPCCGAGSATYTVNADTFSILWGSPDPYNSVTFLAPNGTTVLSTTGASGVGFTGSDLACFASTCTDTGWDLVTFTSTVEIGSVVLSDPGYLLTQNSEAAFEFGTVSATPLPAALPLFGTGLAALGVLGWRRKRKSAAIAA
jgi:hypothetical protein